MKAFSILISGFLFSASLAHAQTSSANPKFKCFRYGVCIEVVGTPHGPSVCSRYEILPSGLIKAESDGTFTVVSENGSVVSNLIASAGTNQDGRPTTTYSSGGTPLLSFETYQADPTLYRNSRFAGGNQIGGIYFGFCEAE